MLFITPCLAVSLLYPSLGPGPLKTPFRACAAASLQPRGFDNHNSVFPEFLGQIAAKLQLNEVKKMSNAGKFH